MRGVNVSLFHFDHDLSWAAFFLNADEQIYGRFGGRDGGSADRYLTLAGLKYALREAIAAHKRRPAKRTDSELVERKAPEEYPAGKRLRQNACIHCHQVYDFQRDELRAAGTWSVENIWKLLPPQPEALGFKLDPDQGNRLAGVHQDSAAARAGLKAGDLLETVNSLPVFSFADVQFALQRATTNTIAVSWKRQGQERHSELSCPPDWRQSDISWRSFMWGLEPDPGLYGRDLSSDEKKELGLSDRAMAFCQSEFVSPAARRAGVRAGDIILGIDNLRPEMTMLQFNAWVRLNRKTGDTVSFAILRDKMRMKLTTILGKQ
jgi:hypothetical protein